MTITLFQKIASSFPTKIDFLSKKFKLTIFILNINKKDIILNKNTNKVFKKWMIQEIV